MFAGFAGYPDELNVTAKDATTFEFVLTAPCAYIEDLMAFPTFYPVKQAAVEAYKDWQTSPGGWCQDAGFVSNGAFVCTEWNHDTSMTYEKNPYWYDADKVTVNKLQFMLSADDTAIYSAYNAGDVDFIDTVPTNEIASLKDVNPEFHIIDALGTYYAAFNCKSALFADKTPEQAACMREAFSILIDRDYIIENVAQCGQKPANSFIPYGMADGNGGIFKTDLVEQGYFDPFAINNDYEGTVEKARTLLKAAGYKFGDDGMLSAETPISLEYLTNEATSHVKIAEAMQQDLAAIGIDMTISSATGTYSSRSARTATSTSPAKAGSPTSTTPSTCLKCGSPVPATTTASTAVNPRQLFNHSTVQGRGYAPAFSIEKPRKFSLDK